MVTSGQECLDVIYVWLGTCMVQSSNASDVSGQMACNIFTSDMLLQQNQPDACCSTLDWNLSWISQISHGDKASTLFGMEA